MIKRLFIQSTVGDLCWTYMRNYSFKTWNYNILKILKNVINSVILKANKLHNFVIIILKYPFLFQFSEIKQLNFYTSIFNKIFNESICNVSNVNKSYSCGFAIFSINGFFYKDFFEIVPYYFNLHSTFLIKITYLNYYFQCNVEII